MNHFAVMGKYWQPGQVKTRLARRLGAPAASQLYRIFLQTLLRRFASIADIQTLLYAPQDREADFRHLANDRWQLVSQSPGNLGRRMQTFFDQAFAQGAQRIVLIGSDSPSLPRSLVEEAYQRLRAHPVVLGPCTDGGFYLIGIRQPLPPVLEEIPWSTCDVLGATLERLHQVGLSIYQLSPWYDIDELQDLERLDRELQQQEPCPTEFIDLAAAVRHAWRAAAQR